MSHEWKPQPKEQSTPEKVEGKLVEDTPLYKKAERSMKALYDEYDNPHERAQKIKENLSRYLELDDDGVFSPEVRRQISESLDACAHIDVEEEFMTQAMAIISIFLRLKYQGFDRNDDAYESLEARVFFARSGMTEVNRVIGYTKEDGVLAIHTPPGNLYHLLLTTTYKCALSRARLLSRLRSVSSTHKQF